MIMSIFYIDFKHADLQMTWEIDEKNNVCFLSDFQREIYKL